MLRPAAPEKIERAKELFLASVPWKQIKEQTGLSDSTLASLKDKVGLSREQFLAMTGQPQLLLAMQEARSDGHEGATPVAGAASAAPETPEEKAYCAYCGEEVIIAEIPPHKHVLVTIIPDHPGSWYGECVVCDYYISKPTREEVLAAFARRPAVDPMLNQKVQTTIEASLEECAEFCKALAQKIAAASDVIKIHNDEHQKSKNGREKPNELRPGKWVYVIDVDGVSRRIITEITASGIMLMVDEHMCQSTCPLSEFGETVFLNRCEAETAMRQEGSESDE